MTPLDAIPEVDAPTLALTRQAHPNLVLLDVREAWEHKMGTIEGAQLLPLSVLPQGLDSFAAAKDARIVTFCHHGMRSLKAASWLLRAGYTDVTSLAGGIDAWAQQIDTTLERY